jgi:Calcineurin-like phosphoesterase
MRRQTEFVRQVMTTAALAYSVVVANEAALAGNGTPFNPHSANVLTLAVYGDAPYGTTPTDTAEFEATPAFIDAVNRDSKVSLVLHVGDLHSGHQYCTQAYDRSIYDLWTQFNDPLVYTPGDNEWTDCHKSGEGGNVQDADGNYVDYANGDPVANLALIRSIFFPTPGATLGRNTKQVISQAQAYDPAHPTDAEYVENVMWEQSQVLFVTVNIPGGSNNDADLWYGAPLTGAQAQDAAQRTAADLRWLDAAFAKAQADGMEAVVIGEQADMWDLDGKPVSHIANYEPFIESIATHTNEFGKPVLLINGDSHSYRSDNPLVKDALCVLEPSSGAPAVPCSDDAWDNHPSYNVSNLHRIVVHGSTFPLEYLRLTVDPRADYAPSDTAFGPFSWERVQP